MEHRAWIDSLIDGDSYRAAAEKVGTNGSTITRQLNKGHLSPEMVISLCRSYGRKPVDGLVETGYLQPWEIEGVGIDAAIDQATNKQLLDGIMRRSDPEAHHLFGLDEDVINPEMDDRNNVVPLRADTPQGITNIQGETDGDTPDVRTDGYDPSRHVAYSGEDEDQLRREQEGDWDDPDHPIP